MASERPIPDLVLEDDDPRIAAWKEWSAGDGAYPLRLAKAGRYPDHGMWDAFLAGYAAATPQQEPEHEDCPTDGCPPYGGQKVSDEGVCEHCGHEVPQQEPEGDGWEPTLEDEACFLDGVNDHLQARQRGEPHDTKLSAYQAGLRAVFHRLRARVQPRRVSDQRLVHALRTARSLIQTLDGRGAPTVRAWIVEMDELLAEITPTTGDDHD